MTNYFVILVCFIAEQFQQRGNIHRFNECLTLTGEIKLFELFYQLQVIGSRRNASH